MKIAVEGCAHGELDKIYNTIQYLQEQEGFTVDLLICCGDFQATRNESDLRCMAVPPKYYNICTFYKYYTGEKVAPVLTIFIGGNHEASNHLQELPYGGWVAPKIYYMGYAGVINIAGIRIGGISGIYKGRDYMKGHFEYTPYDDNTKRSVYHIRNLEVFRLKQISEPLNIFLSHDWPSGVWEHGNKRQLIKFKPFFEKDMMNGELGSKPTEEILNALKPEYWFAAHLHCKFAALISHDCGKITKFLALDKCLPRRRFLQVIDIPHNSQMKIEPSYDLEWLTILRLTNHLLSVKSNINYMPGPSSRERWCFIPTEEEKLTTLEMLDDNLSIPNNFEKTAEAYNCQNQSKTFKQPQAVCNPQTVLFCKRLCIDDPLTFLIDLNTHTINISASTSIRETTSLEETDTALRTSSHRMSALSLPQPVNDSVTREDSPMDEIKADEIQPSPGIINAEDVEVDRQKESNSKRIFKSRNAVIYQNNDD